MSFFANQKNVLAANTALQQAHDSILGGGGTSDEKSESLPALEYSAKMIESVMSRLTSKCVENLVNIDTSHSYKFLVSCVICQNNGTGLHKGSACLWNAANDSSIVVRFENTELMCLATCFAIALWWPERNNIGGRNKNNLSHVSGTWLFLWTYIVSNLLSFCEMQLLFQTDPSANWDTEFMCHVPCGLYKDIHNPVILCCELCTCCWTDLVAPTLDHTQSAWITPTFCSNVQRYDFYYHGLQYTITTGLHDMQLGFNWMQLGCRCNTVHVYWAIFNF